MTVCCAAGGAPGDCDGDGVADFCETDADGNGIPDDCEAGSAGPVLQGGVRSEF